MILNHVADSARSIVESAAALDSEVFCHGYLHAFDMVAIPKRLQERISETEEKHVVHRPLSKVMVDTEDCLLIEGAEQNPVEVLRRGEVPAKRLFDDNPSAVGAARLGQLFDDQAE
jgi:hypothetical protein